MDQIAVAAGVAVGTLYRHFPTKTDLVAAVVSEFVTQVADDTEAALTRVEQGNSAFDELAGLLRDIVQALRRPTRPSKPPQKPSTPMSMIPPTCSGRSAHFNRSSTPPGRIAAVRDDLSIDDFYLLVTNAPTDPSPAILDRWVELMLFGIAGPTPS